LWFVIVFVALTLFLSRKRGREKLGVAAMERLKRFELLER
jgi:hypothetical protein